MRLGWWDKEHQEQMVMGTKTSFVMTNIDIVWKRCIVRGSGMMDLYLTLLVPATLCEDC